MGIASAVLFGASTPFAKLLLGSGISPWLLAGMLYLGSGVGLGLVDGIRRLRGRMSTETRLSPADLPRLALVVVSGGAIAPVLMMMGLTSTPASSASLLLTSKGW